MKNRTDLLIKISFVFVVGDGTVGEEEETVWYLQCPLGSENNGIWGTEFPASEDITWPTCNIQHCVEIPSLQGMAIRVVEFSNGGTKLERFLPKNQHTQRKLNFENWVNGRCQIV